MALRLTFFTPFVLFLVFRYGYGIDARQPAVQIDIGTAARAKRSQCFRRGLAANRTKMARRFGHGANMGPTARWRQLYGFTIRKCPCETARARWRWFEPS